MRARGSSPQEEGRLRIPGEVFYLKQRGRFDECKIVRRGGKGRRESWWGGEGIVLEEGMLKGVEDYAGAVTRINLPTAEE